MHFHLLPFIFVKTLWDIFLGHSFSLDLGFFYLTFGSCSSSRLFLMHITIPEGLGLKPIILDKVCVYGN